MNFLSAAVTLLTGGLTAYREKKQHEADLAKIERQGEIKIRDAQVQSAVKQAELGQQADICLDKISFKHRGWKDEYLLILFTAPLVVLFLAPLIDLYLFVDSYQAGDLTNAVQSGFTALNNTPTWYKVMVGLIFVDTFAFRRLLQNALQSRLGGLAGKLKA